MKIEDHLINLKESLEVINESIDKGLAKRQRNIGFNTSAAAVDMLEIYLHRLNLIDPGFLIKHEWFNSKNKLIEKFPFDFEKKNELFELIIKIESKRNLLCYGKPQKPDMIRQTFDDFNELKDKFREAGLHEI